MSRERNIPVKGVIAVDDLNDLEKDTISEVGNISLGSSATALATILDRSVNITTPRLEVLGIDEIRNNYPVPCLSVTVEYISGLQGSNLLLIREEDALVIAALMMDEPYDGKTGPLGELELSAVQEAMNQMMGTMATSMSELFQRPIEITPPRVERINLAEEIKPLEQLTDQEKVVQVEFAMQVEELIDSAMVQVIPLAFARRMAADLLGGEPGTAPVSGGDTVETAAVSGEVIVEEKNTGPQGGLPEEPAGASPVPPDINGLSDLEKDTIAEVGNISLGASATALSTILDKMVDITTPKLNIVRVDEIKKKYPLPCVLVEVDYISGLEGTNMLLIKQEDAAVIAALMMGEPCAGKAGPMGELELSAVQEAMNQMMGSMATSMSELFQRVIEITPPGLELINLAEDVSVFKGLKPEQHVVHIEFSVKVEDIIDTVMIQVIPVEFAREMANSLLYGYGESLPEEQDMPEMQQQETESGGVDSAGAAPAGAPPVSYEFPPSTELQKLELVRDIPMDIIVVLGSTRMPLGELFALSTGGIIELNCSVNDPVEILANERLLAKGEVVMINDQLGVRITEIQFEEVIESYGI